MNGKQTVKGSQANQGFPLAARALVLIGLAAGGAPAIAAVGATAGQLAVSSSGGATYTVPIFTPPGPRGVQPTLALSYNSASSIGYVGKGWGIAGLAEISRCGKTAAQDPEAGPVSLQWTDAYCINGNRLRLTSGGYGQAGSTYQTEIADFSLITAVGGSGTGPSSWVVKTKSGLIYEYGNSPTSAVLAAGTSTVSIWMVNEIRDRPGNKVVFTYKAADAGLRGTTVPTKIEWAQTGPNSGVFINSINFNYGNNNPETTVSGYVFGTSVLNDDLLNSIDVVQSGAVIRRYNLAYTPSPTTGANRLTQITECSDTGSGNCLAPTTLTYQNGAQGVSTSAVGSVGTSISQYRTQRDFNGDGIRDLAYRQGNSWTVVFGSPSGFTAPKITLNSPDLALGDVTGTGRDSLVVNESGWWVAYTWNSASNAFVPANTNVTFASTTASTWLTDVDGDGRADFTYVASATPDVGFTVSVRRNTSVGGTLSFASPVNTPIEGSSGSFGGIFNADLQRNSSIKRLDFNGDGREDSGFFWYYQDCVDYPTGPVCTPAISAVALVAKPGLQFDTMGVAGSSGGSLGKLMFADWNMDGCTDVLYGKSVSLSGCNNATGAYVTIGDAYNAIDWDGDGRPDGMYLYGGAFNIALSTGVGSGASVATGFTGNCAAVVLDFDGDGLDDLGCAGLDGPMTYYRHNAPGVVPDLLQQVTDGFGNQQTIAYASTTSNVHSPGGALAPGWSSAPRPMQVVQTVTSTDGTGSTFTKTYAYWGQTFSTQGRGFAGFTSRREIDSRNNVARYEHYEIYFPLTGMVKAVEVQQADGTRITRRDSTQTQQVLDATAYSQRYFPLTSAATSLTYQVGGATNGSLIEETTESYVFDSWGNLTSQTRTVTDREAGSTFQNLSWTQTVASAFSPDAGANWCLGVPSAVSATFSGSGEATVVRSQSFTVDYGNCRVSQQFVEPGSANRRVATTYGFDAFGNANAISVVARNSAGADMPARNTYLGWGNSGRFLEAVVDPLTYTSTRSYDGRFGTPTGESDPNGITRGMAYDAFGRLIRVNNPDGTATSYTYYLCANAYAGCQHGDPANGLTSINKYAVQTAQLTTGNGVIADTWDYRDSLGRTISQRTRRMSGSYSRVGREFDSLGRVKRSHAPCAESGCAVYWTATTFDLLGRPISIQRPISESNSGLQTTTIQYPGHTQIITDANAHNSYRVTDPVGRLRRVQDHANYAQAFAYDGYGSLVNVNDTLSNTLFTASYTYGLDAYKATTNDIDLGARTYSYNALGELTSWSDAKGQNFSQTYDALGRLTSRTEPEGTTTWTWGQNAAAFNIGRLASVSMAGYLETYGYDGAGRSTSVQTTTDATYTYWFGFDATTGLPDSLTYPISNPGTANQYSLKLKYDYVNGHLNRVRDFNGSTIFWQAGDANPRGQVSQDVLGNGVVTNRNFDAVAGWVTSIQSGVGGGAALQNESYLHDFVGNVTQRQNNAAGLTENAYYDALNRLDYTTLTNGSGTSTNLDVNYDAMGNITSRSDVASGAPWSYHPTKKHAVTQAGSSAYTYSYDPNGNVTSRHGQQISWSSYDYPVQIDGVNKALFFFYGPDRQRYKQVYTAGSSTETTTYVGGLLEKVSADGVIDWRHYVKIGAQTIAIVSRKSTGANDTRYVVEDHLGSPSSLLNANGTAYVQESFTAFGARRDAATWTDSCQCDDLTKIKNVSRHGFTGHEAVGGVSMGLNHMNGRVQDAISGRFLSPDPFVQDPYSTQNFNRYSYVSNNPLTLSDPSGFCEKRVIIPADGGGVQYLEYYNWACENMEFVARVGMEAFMRALADAALDSSGYTPSGAGGGGGGSGANASDSNSRQWEDAPPIEKKQKWLDRFIARNTAPNVQNDCGAKGGASFPNMDSTYGVFFGGACTNHDACYASKGASHFGCDWTFRREIRQAFANQCPSGLSGFLCVTHGGYIANVYFYAVQFSATGERAFNDAQHIPQGTPISPWEGLYDRWLEYP